MSDPGALSQEEAFARLRLLRSPNVGPVTFRQLLARFGNAVAALDALPEIAGRAGRPYACAPQSRIEQEIAAVRRAGARYIFHDSADFPALLAEAEGAPPILTVRGQAALLAAPCVAMVGARNASAAAIRLARDIAHDLAAEGWSVVSGLARGIDGAAHRGALAARGGRTVGVIASGIDIVYPPEHADLQEEIARDGLLIAEQPPGTEPLARHFPVRNRIIAGLCGGTVVVEAAPRSGSLITARLAGEMGREVMAVPGSPLDSRSHGCNQLIRDGAVLIQNAAEVIELLTGFDGATRSSLSDCVQSVSALAWADADVSQAEPGADGIHALLTTAPVAVDDLVRQSGASVAAVQMALVEIELAGGLLRHAGGRVSRA